MCILCFGYKPGKFIRCCSCKEFFHVICVDQSIEKLIKSDKRQATWRCEGCVPTQEIVHTELIPNRSVSTVNNALPTCSYDIEYKFKLTTSDVQERISKITEEKIQLEKLLACKKYTVCILPLDIFYFHKNS